MKPGYRLLRGRSLVFAVGALFAALMAATAATPVVDPDVWWVAAAGREMLEAHAFPVRNVFSFVEPTHPWVMHEWLFGPVYALGLDRLGPSFFVAVALLTAGVALALVLDATLGSARDPRVGLIVAFIAVAFFGGRFVSARPTGVALLFPLLLAPLAFAPAFGKASFIASSVIELAWTNAHGSFPLGVGLLVVGAVDRKADRFRRLMAAATAALVTCLNPYGLWLHRLVWGYLRGGEGVYRDIHVNIQEFGTMAAAWGSSVGPTDLIGFLLTTPLAALAVFHRRHRVRGVLCLAMMAAGALQARHLEIAGLLTWLLLLPFADDLAERWNLVAPPRADWLAAAGPDGGRRLSWLILLPACSLALILFVTLGLRRTPQGWIAEGPEFIPLLAEVPDGARLYAPFRQAGMAIWYGFPRGVRVFFDSRNDCYSSAVYEAYNALDTPETPPERMRMLLGTTSTDAVLLTGASPLVMFLSHESNWTLSRSTGPWRLYLRSSGAVSVRPQGPPASDLPARMRAASR